jgi:hypothetical protein
VINPYLPCLICQDRDPYKDSLICGGCYARLYADVGTLVGAHTWLGIAMHAAPPGFKAGTIHRSPGPRPPFRVELHDQRVDILGKLAGWVRVIIEEQPPGPGPADGDIRTVAQWLGVRLPWVSDQPWCDEMARELGEAARSARALVPWDRIVRELPLPCPRCGYLTLAVYGGTDTIVCRNRECSRTMIWADYEKAVREKHGEIISEQETAA